MRTLGFLLLGLVVLTVVVGAQGTNAQKVSLALDSNQALEVSSLPGGKISLDVVGKNGRRESFIFEDVDRLLSRLGKAESSTSSPEAAFPMYQTMQVPAHSPLSPTSCLKALNLCEGLVNEYKKKLGECCREGDQ